VTTILVTGGNGFIGRHVCTQLAARGLQAVVYDRQAHTTGPAILGDIRDAEAVTEAAAHVDGIIHLAGVLGTQETIQNPRPAAETNILGGLNVLEAASQYDLPLVYIAVGNWWMDNGYSISKTTIERYCRMYRHDRNLTVSIVRAMNAYGPGQSLARPWGPSKVRKIMPAFICRALTGQPIEIYGDGMQIMDMVYVTDVADTLVRALGTNRDWDAGTGRATTVLEIAEEVIGQVGKGTITHLPMRPGENPASVVLADPDRMLRPADVSLEDGIRETIEDICARLK
jgi:UDP-glucose 4-epimerase